ncbi:hypothetical protein HK405_006068 [Cladochytrium tenue]|nr:hypothetical protein HK405_006068 [Cladochytrium tenue]
MFAFGDRSCLLASLVFFQVGVVGSAAAPSLPVVCFFRSVQGVGSSGFSALSRALALNGLSVGMALSMNYGPIVGGALTDAAGWRCIFIVPLSLAFTPLLTSIALLVSGGAVQLSVTFGISNGWGAPRMAAMFIVAGVAIASFIAGWRHLTAFMMYVPMLCRMTKKASFLISEVRFLPYNLAWAVLAIPAAILRRSCCVWCTPNHVVSAGAGLLALGAGLFAWAVGGAIPNKAAGTAFMALAGAGAALANQNSLYCA